MKFSAFSVYLKRLEAVSSRIEITKILSELFKAATRNEIGNIVNLSLGQLAPSFNSIVFNIAEKMMIQALAKAYSVSPEEILKLYKQKGDLGEVAHELSKNKDSNLTVNDVFDKFVSLAKDEGEGSVERKIEAISDLLQKMDPLSARFTARIPVGKLRLGFSDKTVIDALSWMETGSKANSAEIEKAYFVVADIAYIATLVKEHGVQGIAKKITPVINTPVLPMLAQRVKSPAEMVEKMEEVAVEPKFDGLRAQIHFSKSGVKVFTRNLNDISWMFPELGDTQKFSNATDFIIDTEAVGVDEERKQAANFQTTMTRRRKHDIDKYSTSIPIQFNVFDIMYKNGRSLMDLPYLQRREELKDLFKKNNLFLVDRFVVTKDPQVIMVEMETKLGEGLEGVMVKKLDSKYIAGRTGYRWVKLKEGEKQAAKLADTIDAVVMGFTAGKGKRAGFGLGQFLVGVVDGEQIKTTTKIGTGISDDQFKDLKVRLTKIQVKQKPGEYEVDKNLQPDFWVEPKLIVEIAADEITKSPNHTAGLALRFPRLIKFRDDKDKQSATTLTELHKLFELQKK
ncbi:MAG: ATP-dependent DNA ligase [Patescibacteria group bacterium]